MADLLGHSTDARIPIVICDFKKVPMQRMSELNREDRYDWRMNVSTRPILSRTVPRATRWNLDGSRDDRERITRM